MATALSERLRSRIVNHVTEIYYPSEVLDAVQLQFATLWKQYLETAIGTIPSWVPQGQISFKSKDDRFRALMDDYRYSSFKGEIVFLPFIELRYGTSMTIDLDSCPVQGIRTNAETLSDMMNEKKSFETALRSELMKVYSIETFLKKFPQMKGALAPFIPDEITDLPVEAEIDMTAIAI